jgi:hypothetical protein
MRKLAFVTTLALALAAVAPAAADAVSFTSTKINVSRESVDGTRGSQRLSGHVTVKSQRSWRRTSHDGAPTRRFAVATGRCHASARVSVRAVATSRTAKARTRAVTRAGSTAVLADAARPGGWLRIVELDGARPRLYGIAIARVAPNRWADVRPFVAFIGCTDAETRGGAATRGLPL